jgi:DNA polymerase I-like protein with 3'-5' exonuclease and polymerase domains
MAHYITELPKILSWDVVGIDVETTFLNDGDPLLDDLLLIQIATVEDTYFVLPDDAKILIPLLQDDSVLKLFFNASYDLKWLFHHTGVWAKGVWDCMIVEKVLTMGMDLDYSLEAVSYRRLNVQLQKDVRTTFQGATADSLTEEQLAYGAQDAEVLLPIYVQQKREVEEQKIQWAVQNENRCTLITSSMEYYGIPFNQERWLEAVDELCELRLKLNNEIQKYLFPKPIPNFMGELQGINLNSPVKELLPALEKKSIVPRNPLDKDDSGVPKLSSGKDALEHYILYEATTQEEKDILKAILLYRKVSRLAVMDLKPHPVTGNIHAKFWQTGTVTGRYSVSRPPLQQISRPEKEGLELFGVLFNLPNIREVFAAPPGYKMITADYGQQEVRMGAQLSQDQKLIEVCGAEDFHTRMASNIYGKPEEQITGDERYLSKTCVFLSGYGGGAEKFALTAHIDIDTAKEIQKNMREEFPVRERWNDIQLQQVAVKGYINTITGRRIYFPGAMEMDKKELQKHCRNTSRNYPVQGSSADNTKGAMADLYDELLMALAGKGLRIVLQIHDEVVVLCADERAEEVKETIEKVMAQVGQEFCPDVPIVAEAVIAQSWSK